ncbi:GAF domain-containing sensor histidine kinase [Leptolyngbya sp. KIOST-1]|uniref:GAF domain-containing sensor histidine kinase n=1 Tax=Leptolyngbya sp. KIOST-1 TaxID=1229172 RepID=UPI00068AE8F6|nr:GAF domain-containing sensor histidine kinase [Leptolyngbya sp. KIOST-1]
MGVSVFPVRSEGDAGKETGAVASECVDLSSDDAAAGLSAGGNAPSVWSTRALSGLSQAERQQRRSQAIAALGLPHPGSVPAWEEAAQMAARYLGLPLVIVTVADETTEYLYAAFGLSCLGVGNPLSLQRQLPLSGGLGVHILDREQPLVVPDTAQAPGFAQSELVSSYGIRAYCGVPLVTSEGLCLGTLAAMDLCPRQFSEPELGFLAMAARWGMSEFERHQASVLARSSTGPLSLDNIMDRVRLNLISQLTQDLRSPLTTVLGMSTMLNREIYGPLTPKQREYTDIVHRSSQTLIALVDELSALSPVAVEGAELAPTTVDIEALGQQVMATLTPLAEKRTQTLSLTVEPGENHWVLDQRLVKQILYYLMAGILPVAGDDSTLRLHACRRGQDLALGLWLSNPWLGEGLPPEVVAILQTPLVRLSAAEIPRSLLGLLLSQQLVQRHGGRISVQDYADSSSRLMVLLPNLDAAVARPSARSDS